MKKAGWVITVITLFIVSAAMQLKPEKILFFGDSITQMGNNEGGYIALMRSVLARKGKENNVHLIGAGVGGNKVDDLFLRMEKDVIAQQPDQVVIWIGVNDVGHKANGYGTDPEKFTPFYNAIIEKLKAAGIKKILLVTPAVIGERNDWTNPMDGDLNYYSRMIKDIALKYQLPVLDMRTLVHQYEVEHNKDNNYKGVITTDGIHLNEKGNVFVANKMLEALKL